MSMNEYGLQHAVSIEFQKHSALFCMYICVAYTMYILQNTHYQRHIYHN